MKKHSIRVIVALLTFSIGTLIAFLFHASHIPPEETSVHSEEISNVLPAKRPLEGEWRRINIGKVSFFIPTYLKKTGLPGNVGVIEAFGGPFVDQDDLYVNYSYGQKVGTDYNAPTGKPSDLLINGRSAKLYITEFEEHMRVCWKCRPGMKLVVPDVGDGRTKFQIYAVSFDLDLIRQIIETVEIRGPKPQSNKRLEQTRH